MLLIALIVCITAAFRIHGEETWVIFERGKDRFRNKEYGSALALFKQAVAEKKNFPEAEIAIGDVYAASSEFALAEAQYRKAIRLASYFEYPEKIYIARYRLADLYKKSKNNKLLEETLLSVLAEDKDYYENAYLKYREVFPKLYLSQGPDRLLALYRMPLKPFFLKAHSELSLYYYRHGRFEQSLSHSLVSLVSIMSVTISEIKNEDPLFKFTGLESLVNTAMQYESTREYLTEKASVFTILYYLANASYTLGKYAYAKTLWGIVARNRYSVEYKERANNQLKAPVIEEYVDIAPATIDFVWNY